MGDGAVLNTNVSAVGIGDLIEHTIMWGKRCIYGPVYDGFMYEEGWPKGVDCPHTIRGIVVGYANEHGADYGLVSYSESETPTDFLRVKLDEESLKHVRFHWIEEPGYPPEEQIYRRDSCKRI